MFRNILVPVDRSAFAEAAIPYAAGLVRRNRGTLHLAMVHTIVLPEALRTATPPGDALDREVLDGEQQYLDELAARIAAEYEIEPVVALLDGAIAQSLSTCASEREIDLVVLSTHGRGGLERAWLGSVADRLVRTLDVPLLLIRPDREGIEIPDPLFGRIVVGLDGSRLAEDAFCAAAALAVPGARVTGVRVVIPLIGPASPYIPEAAHADHEVLEVIERKAADYLAKLRDRLRCKLDAFDTRVVAAFQPARALVDTAEEVGADLIAVGTHGRRPLMRALIGSVADRVIRLSPIPVLVVPLDAARAGLATGRVEGLEEVPLVK